ncbi:MAG: FAD-dependent monooxygenase [Geminicoccaceae bacterium]
MGGAAEGARMADVLIVGAGPVGLTLAAELARHGVASRLVERLPAPSPYCRAIGVTPRTLEVLEDMGVAAAMMDAGIWLRLTRLVVDGAIRAEIPSLVDGVPYPTGLGIPQYATERVLTEHLARHGGRIERGVALTGLAQDADGVRATLQHADGSVEEQRCAYVVGCDGAHSAVRKAVGIGFPGEAYPVEFMLGDVRVAWDLPPGIALRAIRTNPEGMPDFLVAIPLPEPGRYRLSSFAPGTSARAPDAGPEGNDVAHGIQAERATPSLAELQRTADTVMPGAVLSELRWSSIFRISLRLADAYAQGRVFLAGDAAHIHPPTGGQGMNTGIQDAYNLAWKLARVLRGRASADLLASYEAERRPVAEEVLARTAEESMAFMAGRPGRGGDARGRLDDSQLMVSYRAAGWVEDGAADPNTFGGGPVPGDRAPDAAGLVRDGTLFPQRLHELLRGPEPVLLLRVDADGLAGVATAAAELRREVPDLRAYAIAAEPIAAPPALPVLHDSEGAFARAYGGGAGSLWLVRPDGHLGYRADSWQPEGLLGYLQHSFVGAPAA